MIFVGQRIDLAATITEGGQAIDISGGTVLFDYYLPGNISSTPDGSVAGSIVSGPDGTVSGVFPADLNSLSGDYRFQAAVTISGDTYLAKSTCLRVYPKGAC